jgi:hypothetical protein
VHLGGRGLGISPTAQGLQGFPLDHLHYPAVRGHDPR